MSKRDKQVKTVTAAEFAELLGISTMTLTRWRRDYKKVPAPLPKLGRKPLWSRVAVEKFLRTRKVSKAEPETKYLAWGEDGAAQLAHQGAFDGADAKAASRQIRATLGLPLDAPKVSVMAAILDLQAKLSKTTADLNVLSKHLKHLQTEIRRVDAIAHPLAVRVPDIKSAARDVERKACLSATLKELEATGLDPLEADNLLSRALNRAAGDTGVDMQSSDAK